MDFEALRIISDETEQIRQTYTLFREETRLFASKAAQVEFLTTVHYIERYLPAGGRLLDIGEGPEPTACTLPAKIGRAHV